MTTGTVLIAGASGVIGASAVEAFARAGNEVIAVSRRRPIVPDGVACRHVPLDLLDAGACAGAVAALPPVSDFVYAAVAEAPGLAPGWTDPALIETNRAMFTNLARPLAERGTLRWAGLLQGTKAYGAHLHAIPLPARETLPRDPAPNFYWEHEDLLRDLAQRHGFGFTIFRPQIVFGGAPGAAMNPPVAIGAYAALCRAMGEPFSYPANHALMWEATDAALLAEAFVWARSTPHAANETFNVTNGDVFVMRHEWDWLAGQFGLPTGPAMPEGLAAFFARDDARQAWRHIAARHQLVCDDLDSLVGQSHHYVDMLLSDRMAEGGRLPVLVSGIKLRQAGFAACRDSRESLLFWLRRMAETRVLPPDLLEGP